MATPGAAAMQFSPGTTAKRLRLSDAGPGAGPGSISTRQQHDELVELLTSRGGRIQQLETDLEKALARAAEAERQTQMRDAELRSQRHEAGLWRAVKEAEYSQLTLSAQQLGKQLEREMARAAGLEERLAAAGAEKAEWSARAQELSAQLDSARGATRREAALLQQRADAAERELQQARADAGAREQQAARQLAAEHAAKDAQAARAALFEQQLQEVTAQAEALVAKNGELELAAARAEGRAAVAEAVAAGASEGEVATQLAALRSQVRQQEAELAAAGQAIKVAAAAGALQRQLERARAEAAAAQQLAARLPDVEAEAGRIRAELDQWRVLFKKATGQEHPSPQAVTAMQGELLRAQQQLADLRVEATDLRTRLDEGAKARAALQAAATKHEAAAAAAARKLQLAEGRAAVVQQEVEGLKKLVSILESAEAEQGGGGSGGGQAATVAEAKVAALTAELEATRAQLAGAEALAAAAADDEAKHRAAADEAAAEKAALEREVEALGSEVARLQACVAAGDYNPETTRILHMTANPASERRRLDAEASIARLQAECTALQRQLRAARKSGGGGGGGTGGEAGGAEAMTGEAGVALAHKEAELAMAQQQITQVTRQLTRTKDLLSDQIKAFREAVKFLFGYKVDMQVSTPGSLKGALVILRPDATPDALRDQAPGDRDPQLQFRFTAATGRLELLPTTLSRAQAKSVATFIEGYGSVPWFTANLISDLYSKGAAASAGGPRRA